MKKYRVFYSKDCLMYGVQELKSGVNYSTEEAKWGQITPPRKSNGATNRQSVYTYYKGVAKRWLKELERSK